MAGQPCAVDPAMLPEMRPPGNRQTQLSPFSGLYPAIYPGVSVVTACRTGLGPAGRVPDFSSGFAFASASDLGWIGKPRARTAYHTDTPAETVHSMGRATLRLQNDRHGMAAMLLSQGRRGVISCDDDPIQLQVHKAGHVSVYLLYQCSSAVEVAMLRSLYDLGCFLHRF
jgi:hypothetical protein